MCQRYISPVLLFTFQKWKELWRILFEMGYWNKWIQGCWMHTMVGKYHWLLLTSDFIHLTYCPIKTLRCYHVCGRQPQGNVLHGRTDEILQLKCSLISLIQNFNRTSFFHFWQWGNHFPSSLNLTQKLQNLLVPA